VLAACLEHWDANGPPSDNFAFANGGQLNIRSAYGV
jgi:hypothetical protein